MQVDILCFFLSPIPEQGHTGSYMSGVANEESVPDQQDMDM